MTDREALEERLTHAMLKLLVMARPVEAVEFARAALAVIEEEWERAAVAETREFLNVWASDAERLDMATDLYGLIESVRADAAQPYSQGFEDGKALAELHRGADLREPTGESRPNGAALEALEGGI